MNCQQIQAYLKTNLGKKVPREMGKVIKEHLKDCSQCQKSYQQLYKSYMAKKQQIPKGSYEPSEESAFLPITFPGMKIVKKLGQGAMGKVYQAFQLSLKRHVALKVLSKDLAKNEKFVKRFLREARALAKLKHPNIVAIYDVGFSQGLFYYIMEFVDGRSLKEILHEKEVLEPKEALNIVKEVAKALVEAEAHDIVHRDIKPGNILIDQNGQIKLADLGLAKTRWKDQKVSEETAVGTLIGTPHYMAPEQIRNSREVTIQADIYSLGVTFYQMVTGHLPYTGNTNFEVLSNILQEEVEFDEKEEERIPLGYRQIMLKMMAKDPKERYKSPKELLEDIKLMKESGSQTLVASSFLQLDKESKSLIFWSITVGALGMLVVSLLAFMIFGFPSQKKKTSNTTTSPSSQNHSHQSQTTHSHSSGTTTGSGSPLPHPPKSTFQEPKPFSFTYDLYLAIANHKIKNNEWIRLLQPALIVKKEVFISNKKLQTIIYITNSRVSVDDLAVYFPFYLQELEVGDGVILHKGKLHY
ncbi:MAG: serine/threonine protein kinase, partial [Planctomycetota bacterium]